MFRNPNRFVATFNIVALYPLRNIFYEMIWVSTSFEQGYIKLKQTVVEQMYFKQFLQFLKEHIASTFLLR